jgi:hypothetical protein
LPALILPKARAARDLTVGYFRQEGVLDDEPYGIVDTGWTGRTHDSFAKVVTGAGGRAPHGFYFGLTARRDDDAHGVKEAYFFDAQANTGHVTVGMRLRTFLESFCAGDHGRVLGYEDVDGVIRPRLERAVNTRLIDWGLPVLRETIRAFVVALVVDPSLNDPRADVRPAIADVLGRFHGDPERREALAWSRYLYEEDLGGYALVGMARPYDWRSVWRGLVTGDVADASNVQWYAGSLAISPRPIELAIRLLGRGRRDFRRVGHVLSRAASKIVGARRALATSGRSRQAGVLETPSRSIP